MEVRDAVILTSIPLSTSIWYARVIYTSINNVSISHSMQRFLGSLDMRLYLLSLQWSIHPIPCDITLQHVQWIFTITSTTRSLPYYMCLTSPSLDAADPCVCRFIVCYSNISKIFKTQRTISNSICCIISSLGMIARDPNRHYVYKVAESWESGGERRRLISAYSFSTMPSAFAGMLTHVAIKIIGGNASLSIVSTCNR